MQNILFAQIPTITVQVISFISPASGLRRVARWRAAAAAAAATVLCQEVSQSEGLPLLILLFS